jgi:hypothetical protein
MGGSGPDLEARLRDVERKLDRILKALDGQQNPPRNNSNSY